MTANRPIARVIEDSISGLGHRLTTIEVVLHRYVLAELNTHRVFSRNSASSRAIPVHKVIDRVVAKPAMPVAWPKEQRGMQGGSSIEETKAAKAIWLQARDDAVRHAMHLHELGVHKSVINRLLEPFSMHTVIITATDWGGFWRQRCSPLAQPELRQAAEAIRKAYDASEPKHLNIGQWHMPYITDEDRDEADGIDLRAISAARCARVSYLTHEGRRDLQADADLFHRLVVADPPHASPLEHVATPCELGERAYGNFTGWRQLRHQLLGV